MIFVQWPPKADTDASVSTEIWARTVLCRVRSSFRVSPTLAVTVGSGRSAATSTWWGRWQERLEFPPCQSDFSVEGRHFKSAPAPSPNQTLAIRAGSPQLRPDGGPRTPQKLSLFHRSPPVGTHPDRTNHKDYPRDECRSRGARKAPG